MRRTLFVAALAALGGCDQHHGIGALGSDAGRSSSDAGIISSDPDTGVGVGTSIDMGGGTPIPPGSGVDAQSIPTVDAGMGVGPRWDAGGGTPIPPGSDKDAWGPVPGSDTGVGVAPGWDAGGGKPPTPGRDAGIPLPVDAGGGTLPVHDAGPAATGPLSQGPTSWTGYIENYQFPSGSDVIRFTSTVAAAGQVMVTVFLGDSPPPPPATDPNVGYLVDQAMGPNYWAEGVAYTMTSGTFQPQRLRFTISSYQLWSGWCALQTPINGSDACVPNFGGASCFQDQCYEQDPATGQVTWIDAGKFNLCFMCHVCACSTTACVSDPTGGQRASFDVALVGPAADGSVIGLIGERANVHFTLDGP